MKKGFSNNFPNFYNDCAASLDFRDSLKTYGMQRIYAKILHETKKNLQNFGSVFREENLWPFRCTFRGKFTKYCR